jgi:hypothetical protein
LLSVGLLAVVSLAQTGCQSGPLGPCGFVTRATNRIIHPFRGAGGGCCGGGSEVITEAPFDYGAPAAVVVPGPAPAVGVPAPPPGQPADSPSSLEAIPSAVPGNDTGALNIPGRTNRALGTARSSYETVQPNTRVSRSRSRGLAPTVVSTPTPTPSQAASGHAKEAGTATSRSGAASASTEDNPLDHLPPLDLPSEVTERSSSSPPAPPAATRPSESAPVTGAAASGVDRFQANPRASNNARANAVAEADEGEVDDDKERGEARFPVGSLASLSTPEPIVQDGEAPGIREFSALDVKLAGGSEPSREGLDWLADKGYKTLLDLRDSSEVSASFVADVTSRGMRHVPLPLGNGSIDPRDVARFNFELTLSDARPLFFFDADGKRAGALWYIRRVALDRVDPPIARREAEDLGLIDPSYWDVAKRYVAQNVSSGNGHDSNPSQSSKPASEISPSATTPATTPAPKPAPAVSPAAPSAPATPQPRQAASDAPSVEAELGASSKPISVGPDPASIPALPRDPNSWRPYAAMMLTGLTVPLAYWSRSMLPVLMTRTLASLPTTARQPKSLPPGSDE